MAVKIPAQKDPSKTSAAHDVMAPRIDLIATLMGGTEVLRDKGQAYLPRYTAESEANWNERLHRATLTNYFRRTIESLVGKPFSNPIVFGDDMPKELVDLSENIDHEGNHINVFGRRVFQDALSKGLTHILVEYPNTIAAGVQTKADEVDINATPYFVHILPENILAAYCENRNGVEFLTHVRIFEQETVRDGFDEVVVQRVRVLEPGKWELWRKDARNRWAVEDSGETSLDFIPLITFYADREDFMVAHPPLLDLAYLNIAHWQSSADQTNILTVARFPMLAGSGVNDEEAQIKIGPKQLLTTMNPDGKYYYVEHSGKAIDSGRQHIKDLQEEMSILGIELLKKSGDATATAKAIDTAENLSMLQALAILFGDALEQAYDIAAKWMNLGKKAGSVTINSDFGLSMNDAVDVPVLQFARTAGEISHDQFISELQRRGILADDFDPEADAALLEQEATKSLDDQAFEHSLRQQNILPGGTPDENGKFPGEPLGKAPGGRLPSTQRRGDNSPANPQ